jgi:alpha/beta superfamily hydrolase
LARKIESLFIDGPAGRLEALLEAPEEAPREVALVCHPHPQHGGTMHNKVVYRIARGLRRAGAVTLRFNYRGVNLSAGQYAEGEGELDDARAALDYVRSRYPDLPCTLAGFSFGSRIVLRLAEERVSTTRRVIPVGFPDRYRDLTDFDMPIPRIFIQSTHDEFGPLESIRSLVDSLTEPKRLILVEAQDHFFAGGLDQLEKEIFELD